MYSRILVPCDGSLPSMRGLEEAIALAADQRAKLCLVHVVDESILAFDTTGTLCWDDFLPLFLQGGKTVLEKASWLARERGLEAETFLLQSGPAPVAQIILRQAREWGADLIVMGTHGRRGLRRLVLGSDAEAVVRTAEAPVLLVKGPDELRRLGRERS